MGIALITGASAGLGTEFAKIFAAQGHSVILVARRRDRLEQLATELRQTNPSIQTWVIDLDLSETGAGQILFRHVQELKIEIDFWVNNAGFGSGGLFAQLPLPRELQMMDLNMRTLVETTHLFLPSMLRRRSGRILNVGSLAGFQAGPYMATYSATKAFVNSFSEALHQELSGTGVTCTVLAPGMTITEFQQVAELSGFSKVKGTPTATADAVAADGYRAMMKGAALKVSGSLNQLSVQSLRLAPRGLVRRLAARLNRTQI